MLPGVIFRKPPVPKKKLAKLPYEETTAYGVRTLEHSSHESSDGHVIFLITYAVDN